MLVLGRKENQSLIIDGKIIVTVVKASNGSVRLGVEAPLEISVQREELLRRAAATTCEPLAASGRA
jgi:carbon storage regulator